MIYQNHLKNSTKLFRKRLWHRLRIGLNYFFNREDRQAVFIIATRRSGSNLLTGYLNSIPGVTIGPEILNSSMYYGLRERFISKRAVLRHIRHSLNAYRKRICGAKLLAVQMEHYGITMEDLKRHFPNARFIVLYRKSLLDQFISLKIAERTDCWQQLYGETVPEPLSSIAVNTEEFKAFAEFVPKFYAGIFANEWMKERSVCVSYEELKDDAQRVFQEKIFGFLGTTRPILLSRYIKQNRRPVSEVVRNFDEIVDFKETLQEYS